MCWQIEMTYDMPLISSIPGIVAVEEEEEEE